MIRYSNFIFVIEPRDALPPTTREIPRVLIEHRQLRYRYFYDFQYGFGLLLGIQLGKASHHLCGFYENYSLTIGRRSSLACAEMTIVIAFTQVSCRILFSTYSEQITTFYNQELVIDAILTADPIHSAETLIAIIVLVTVTRNILPPLAVHALGFLLRSNWPVYKRAQQKIYVIAIATLQVGKSSYVLRAIGDLRGWHHIAIYDSYGQCM